MKKLIALLLITVIAFTVVSCSGSGKAKIADDTSVMAMSFTAPEGYKTVGRGTDVKSSDGSLTEKDIVYDFEDGTHVMFAYAPDQKLTDELDLSTLETKEAGGVTFYLQTYSSVTYAYAQYGDDVYGVALKGADSNSESSTESSSENKSGLTLDDVLKGITFTETTETKVNENVEDFGDLTYAIDESLFVNSVTCAMIEKPDGTLVSKSDTWSLGSEEGKTNYRFSIVMLKDTTVDEKIQDFKDSGSYEMGEKTINDITYTTVKYSSEAGPLSYYVQHGSDVYQINNNGISNGLWTTRSEESFTVFETFLNSIKIK